MKYEDKSKEELINEIKKLQKNYNFLDESINKRIIGQQMAAKISIDIIDKNPLAIQLLNMEGYTIHVNPAHTKLFGVVPPPDYTVFKDFQLLKLGIVELIEKIKKGEKVQFPSIYYNAHEVDPTFPDKPLWLTSKVFTLDDSNGKPETIVIIHEDFTEGKDIENELQESNWKFRALFEKGPIGVAYHVMVNNQSGEPIDYFFLDANESYRELTGVDPRGKLVTEAFPGIENDPFDWIGTFGKVARTGETIRFEQYLESNHRWYDCVGYQYKPDHFVAAFLEITKRKQAEIQLHEINEKLFQTNLELTEAKEKAEENEERFKILSSIASEGLMIHENGIVLEANIAFAKLIGFANPNEIIGKNALEITPLTPESKQTVIGHINRNSHETYDVALIDKNGTLIQAQTRASEIIFKGRKARLVYMTNISERKKIELELKKAKEQAEESDRLKTAFLQNMSHEIRTPMNAIMGFSGLLVENHDNKLKLEKFSGIINQRCTDLLDIINDILDISKIESGQLTVNNDECNISELFHELNLFFNEYKKRINKQHIMLSFESLCDFSHSVIQTDTVKLKQILINLIGNAFKFTDNGLIKCCCKPDNDHILFYVSDTGIGIPKDEQERVFERFSQLHHTQIKNIGGTGLGLSIARGLTGLLGGTIWLESKPEEGATFFFTIKFNKSKSTKIEQIRIQSFDDFIYLNKTILIVEDDTYNAEYLKEILENTGLKIITTEFGNDAVQIATTQPIDLILMDIRLPDINGYEATSIIKQSKPDIMIIAQTAYAAHDERQKALDSGCIDYISKPTNRELLMTLLRKYMSAR